LDKEPLLYNRRPTATQARTASTAALVVTVLFLVTLPFRDHRFAAIDAFIPVSCALLLMADGVTATLFLAAALVLRSKALMALGTGYFFTALIIVPAALTFPSAVSPAGLLGGSPDTPLWLYIFWHCGLPVSIIAYALLKNSPAWAHTASVSPSKAMALCLLSATLLVGALTLLTTAGAPLLPQLLPDHTTWRPGQVVNLAVIMFSLFIGAMVVTWRRRSSVVDLWLLLVLLGWLAELLLTMLAAYRFSVGWYSGRIIGLLSGQFVLFLLLAQTSRLYMRAVQQVKARLWERENRLMIRDVITGSITHELRQPLGAIMLNAEVAKRLIHKPEELSVILDDVLADSRRANEIMEGTRAMFCKNIAQRHATSVNQLISGTLSMMSRELRDMGVSVELRLDTSLQPIAVNRLQIEQVFFNLFMNAAEAMSTITDRPRVLTVQSGFDDHGQVIKVEDTGPGISTADRERIFDSFYTTKNHGTGLGLSICRSIIAAHGGTLYATPRKPVGATFEIHLPFNSGADAIAQANARLIV
jgi:signal transduction histidine kinase